MLKNASFLAIVAVHTAENEPPKVLKNAKKFLFKMVQGHVAGPPAGECARRRGRGVEVAAAGGAHVFAGRGAFAPVRGHEAHL